MLGFRADPLNAIEVADRWRVEFRMIDAPSGAMRPVQPDAVAHLTPEERVARHAQGLGLGIQQRVLDRSKGLAGRPVDSRP